MNLSKSNCFADLIFPPHPDSERHCQDPGWDGNVWNVTTELR